MSSRRLSICMPAMKVKADPRKAAQAYIKMRQYVREAFESFLRNLNLKALSELEKQFEEHGGDLNSSNFLKVFTQVFPEPEVSEPLDPAEMIFIQQSACLQLFESVDVDMSGEASWMEFVEFVCAIAEQLRLQVAEESGQTFDFHLAEQVAVPFRPTITKCHFDRLFFWPEHPLDAAIVFEEGQPAFHLHWPKTMARKRRIEGHRQEILSAAFIKDFNYLVTSGNDNLVCFYDENFNLIKKWTLDHVWTGEKGKVTSAGALCWCSEIKALFAADHFSEKIKAWRIPDPMEVRLSEGAFEPDKRLSLQKHSTHTKAIQSICWMNHLKCLATASLDTTVQIFDLVQMKRTHILTAHKRGLTCLQYCPKNHMLLSSGFDNYISIWDPGAGTLSFTLEGHDCSVAGLCAIPDTDFEFMSVDFEGQVRHWDVRRLVCLQSFCATDRQAEKNGELEALEPRAICPLGRDRVLISGRRMVVFDREASNPRVTADWPINAIAFNPRSLEIVTPIKNDLYIWCALTGRQRSVHDNVLDGTITAITLAIGERRIFVGADNGEIIVVNYACGALLKSLTSHAYEVTQITCLPEKILSLSAPEKVILVHDDNDPSKSVVLKRIDVSGAGVVTQFAYDGKNIVAGASEDWKIVWYNMDFAKEVSNTDGCEVTHQQSVSCCAYFADAPLLATADAEGCVIFWSVPPLRTYNFYSKIIVNFGDAATTYSISAMDLAWPDEECMYIGVERGHIACVSIKSIVQNAKTLRTEILHRKANGEAAEVISGRIFESMPKPVDSPEYVSRLENVWLVNRAHRGSVDKIVVCKRKLPVILTLGSDACVRIWSHSTGEALGTLEQGLPEGLSYERETTWRFPMDAEEEIARDRAAIADAAAEPEDSEDGMSDDDDESRDTKSVASSGRPASSSASVPKAAPTVPAQPDMPQPRLAVSKTVPDLHAARSPSKASKQSGRSSRRTVTLGAKDMQSAAGKAAAFQRKPLDGGRPYRGKEWYAGPHSPGYWAPESDNIPPMGLPRLKNGMQRPKFNQSKDLVAAARRLSSALGDIETRNGKDIL